MSLTRLILKDGDRSGPEVRQAGNRKRVASTVQVLRNFKEDAEVKLATITESGDIKCPECGVNIITPIGVNPNTGNEEKAILVAGKGGKCLLCKTPFTVTPEEAKKHNHFWFPDDAEFK